jgi:hypothetical protein
VEPRQQESRPSRPAVQPSTDSRPSKPHNDQPRPQRN